MKNKIALFLAVCLCVISLGACKQSELPKAGKTREKNVVTATVTPTAEPTAEPTLEPTVTVTPQPTPIPGGRPWSTPNFTKVNHTGVQAEFDLLLDDLVKELSQGLGLELHFIFENPENFGVLRELNFGSIEDGDEYYAEYAGMCKQYRERLNGIDYNALTDGQKLNYNRLAHELEAGLKYQDLKTNTYCGLFSINNNAISNLSTIVTEYAILNRKDAEDLIAALDTLPEYLDKVIEAARKSYITDGCLLTDGMIDEVTGKVDDLLVTENNPWADAFAENLKQAGLGESEYQELVETFRNKLFSNVFPALKKFGEEAEKMRANVSKEPFGMCKLPGGKEFFEFLAQETVGVSMNGYQMLEYMQKRFDSELTEWQKVVYSDLSILSRYPYDGYRELDAEKILNSLKEYIKNDYPAIPDTEFIVSALPKALQIPGVLAYFLSPQYDNQGRKVIRFNPSGVTEDDGASFFSTLAHEGYPGHLYQNEFFANCEGYHPINQIFGYTGYMEGWAVIAGQEAYKYIIPDEKLAFITAGDYNLSMEMISITAIGVHYAGWNADDVKAFLKPYGFAQFAESFYEEVLADPVVYLPYTFGRCLMLDTMDKLKEKGYTDLEAKTAILNMGPCTFDVLWKNLDIQ